MVSKEIFITGLITTDHIVIENGGYKSYLGSIGGGSAANVYFTLKTFNTPAKLIGAVGEKKPYLSKVAIKDFINDLDENIIYHSKNSETREYYHIIERKNGTWRHKFSSASPFSNSKQSFSVQLRKSYFFKKFNDSIMSCAIFYLDRLSKGLLELAEIAKKRQIPIIFDFGTISTRYLKTNLILKAIKMANIIQIPKNIHEFLRSQLEFKKLQDINPNIDIWVLTDGSNPLKAYHSKIGEIVMDIPHLDNTIDSGGAGDAFMAIMIRQIYFLRKDNKKIIDMDRGQFEVFIKNCIENAKKACMFIGSRTYLYEYIESRNKFRSLNDYFSNYEYNGNNIEKSKALIENYGKRIQEINDSMNQRINKENLKLKKGLNQFESNLLNISKFIPYVLEKTVESLNIKDLGGSLILIGSGASFSVAKAIQQIFSPPNNVLSTYSFTPYQYILKINENYPICIISYSGTNNDVKSCFKKAKLNKSKKIYLLTSNRDSVLSKQVEKHTGGKVFYINTYKSEKGFVGVYSMIGNICVLAKILLSNNWKSEYSEYLSEKNLHKLINSYIVKMSKKIQLIKNKNPSIKNHIVALGTNWAEPVLYDLESKIVESNLGTIEISELKNFTHGRYVNLYKNPENRLVLIFKTPETENLTDFLTEKLSKIAPTIVLETKKESFLGMIDLFIQMLVFINELGKIYHQDPSKPGFPEAAKGLYNWNGLL
ncbi:MAG: hypothetical protein CEE43_13475 [Promethearchaeota archaeon Loki_b32]|nr:MAG: hypothetical protein CEE43_13475 [Candidatus Lokiarchaeota archaeon Loki_b32]